MKSTPSTWSQRFQATKMAIHAAMIERMDRCEQNNLADSQPERVRAMAARWKE